MIEKLKRLSLSRAHGKGTEEKTPIQPPPGDYSVYKMSAGEGIAGFAAGAAAGFAAVFVFFGSWIVSAVSAIPAGIAGFFIARHILIKKRRRRLLVQFKDMLESLSASFLSGRNIWGAFDDAFSDIRQEHGSDALMTRELLFITSGVKNGIRIEELLSDLAVRSGEADIRNFADTFSACVASGGDLRQTVAFSRDIIGEKISVEMEIEAAVASGRNELNILSFMPFAVVLMLKTLGNEAVSGNTALNIAIRIAAAVIFVCAYLLGRRITDIKI